MNKNLDQISHIIVIIQFIELMIYYIYSIIQYKRIAVTTKIRIQISDTLFHI